MRVLISVLFLSLSAFTGLLGADVKISRIPYSGIQPQLQVDASGKLHMIYYIGEVSAGDLFYVNRGYGTTAWSKPIRINDTPKAAVAAGTIRGAHMSIGKGNRIHVSWFGSANVAPKPPEGQHPQAPLMVNRMTDDGKGFEPERNVMTWTRHLDGGGSITADQKGHVYAAWHGRGDSKIEGEMGRTIFLAHSMDEGKTFSKEVKIKGAPAGSCACCGMRAFSHPDGALHIVYRGIQGKIRPMIDLWSIDGGKTFQKTIFDPWEIDACPMSSVTLLPLDDKFLIGSEQAGHIRLNIKPMDDSSIIPFSEQSEIWNGKHPSMASDPNGNILLTWAEGAGWAKGGKLRWAILNKNASEIASDKGENALEIPVWSFPSAIYFEGRFQIIY